MSCGPEAGWIPSGPEPWRSHATWFHGPSRSEDVDAALDPAPPASMARRVALGARAEGRLSLLSDRPIGVSVPVAPGGRWHAWGAILRLEPGGRFGRISVMNERYERYRLDITTEAVHDSFMDGCPVAKSRERGEGFVGRNDSPEILS